MDAHVAEHLYLGVEDRPRPLANVDVLRTDAHFHDMFSRRGWKMPEIEYGKWGRW